MSCKDFTLKNINGVEVHLTNFGGIITSILIPQKDGGYVDIVLGFDKSSDYQKYSDHPYFGAIIGRYGNRIAHGKFTLDGKDYQLPVNNGRNALHGGNVGFDKVFWKAEFIEAENSLKLEYRSVDGEEGFPGNLDVTVIYSLNDFDELKISYEAQTDKATPVNLTNHTYFNLQGHGTILNHELMIRSEEMTTVNAELIPTGDFKKIKGTVMDFSSLKRIGKDIDKVTEGSGYDHNYILNSTLGAEPAAVVVDPESGRRMEMFTTQPGVQLYTGNFLDGKIPGKKGHAYQKNEGFCLETQHFADSPNHPQFPSTILRPGGIFQSSTIYKFYF